MTWGYTSGTIGFDKDRSCDALRFLPLPPPPESPIPPVLSAPADDPRPSAGGMGSGLLPLASAVTSFSLPGSTCLSSDPPSFLSSVSSLDRVDFSFPLMDAEENSLVVERKLGP